MRSFSWVALVAAVALGCWPSMADAEAERTGSGTRPVTKGSSGSGEPTAEEVLVARQLFAEATRLEAQQRWREAQSRLERVVAIKETPGVRYHLGYVQERQGLLVEALIDYDRAAELIQRGVRAPDVEELLDAERKALQPQIPTLSVQLLASGSKLDVPVAELSLDGRNLSKELFGTPIPLNPGSHSLVVKVPGYKTHASELKLKEGERRRLDIELVLEQAPKGVPAQPSEHDGHESNSTKAESGGVSAKTVALLSGSLVTLSGLAVGVVFALKADSASDRVDRAAESLAGGNGSDVCVAPDEVLEATCNALSDAVAERDDARLVSNIGWIGASVGAAATLLSLVLFSEDTAGRVSASAPPRGDGFALRYTLAF